MMIAPRWSSAGDPMNRKQSEPGQQSAMTTPRFNVIQTEHLDAEAAQWLADRVNLIVCRHDDPGFASRLAEADGLVVRTYTQVNAALLDCAPRLRVVARAGVGVDNIDLGACAQRGVVVVNAPDANTEAVVEFVFAVMLDALRPRLRVQQAVDAAKWRERRDQLEADRQLDEITLGILGLGRIGRRIAAVGNSFGMRTIYHDLLDIPFAQRAGAEPVNQATLLRQADVLTIHLDGRPGNRHLIGARELALMRDDVLLINTSRGFVIDPGALAAFLTAHAEAQARLGVHDPEPIEPGDPLLALPNAHLTPHIAGRTRSAMKRMSDVVYDVWAVLEGRAPVSPVREF